MIMRKSITEEDGRSWDYEGELYLEFEIFEREKALIRKHKMEMDQEREWDRIEAEKERALILEERERAWQEENWERGKTNGGEEC